MIANDPAPLPTVLLSYDVSGRARSLAVRVCHLVFGRGDSAEAAPPPYILSPGVFWVGQSVLLMPQPIADELAAKLRTLGVMVSTAVVRVDPAELRAFRRRPPRYGGFQCAYSEVISPRNPVNPP